MRVKRAALVLDHNFPRLAIDQSTFCRALDSGAIDVCLTYVRRDEIGGSHTAWLVCRLAETLFYRGRKDDALECGRVAFAAAGDNADVVHFCAWLFSNCGCHDEAAAAYERLLEHRPEWVEGYRHASGALAAVGEKTRAIALATKASDLAPRAFEFALHAGCLLFEAGRAEEARTYLARATHVEPRNPHALRALSAADYALAQTAEALDLALQAAALAPDDADVAIHAAELLLRNGRFDDALALLDSAIEHGPPHPGLWRLASAAEAERGKIEPALAAIDHALTLAPANAEYHLHRAHLLRRSGRPSAAAEAIAEAVSLAPGSREARRAQLDLLVAEDRLTDATALGGEMLRVFPDDEKAAEAVLRVLNRRLDTIDGDYVVLGARDRRIPRETSREPGFLGLLERKGRVIHALIIRETRTRFGDTRLGYGWALIEPILHILLLSTVFSLLMHGKPPIGAHFFVFYYTGLIPYHVFVHTSTSMMHGVTSNGSLLQLPPVKPFDVILARGILEFATDIVVAVVLLTGFVAIGIPAIPDNPLSVATALIATALLGCGVGFMNGVAQSLFRSWDKLWNTATRLLYFFSGIFYVPGMMPDWARDILAWNPLLHAIDWVRAGFFASYQPHWLDRGYLMMAAALALLAGFALERGLRRRLYEPA